MDDDPPGRLRRMPPVTKIALGFVFAFGALRFNGFDLLFDPVGWGLCAAGLAELQRSVDDPFGRARSFAVAVACASFVAMLASGERSSHSLTFSHVVGLASTAGALVTVWLVVDAIIRRIRPYEDSSRVALLDVLRWAVVSLGVLGLLSGYGYADLGVVTPIAWFATVVILIVVLYRSAELPYLSPT
ncbi:hypothetical protein [Nonomuraea sp. NEAU-A123]|uniref:hypothetical protein n=1 Tax=Nonomuraea sp. NEAU-A123 TaxID=2839649 RepID=UPI001BE4B78C|nr:hypothetical protein [Nonomuraea sp. NEAU-A123]MBT2234659.1 hypothetical protein [Nonomuraea sp. NEAU-A123]